MNAHQRRVKNRRTGWKPGFQRFAAKAVTVSIDINSIADAVESIYAWRFLGNPIYFRSGLYFRSLHDAITHKMMEDSAEGWGELTSDWLSDATIDIDEWIAAKRAVHRMLAKNP